MARPRTTIAIEESYVRTVMDRVGVHTENGAVESAPRYLAAQPLAPEEVLAMAMRGSFAIEGTPGDAGPRGAS